MHILSGKLYQGTLTGAQNHAAQQIILAKHHGKTEALHWCARVLEIQVLPHLLEFDYIVPVQSLTSAYSIPQAFVNKMMVWHGTKFKLALYDSNHKAQDVHGQRIALVDDVLDSGTTARKCLKAITAAGGRVVLLASVAHSADFDSSKISPMPKLF
jgi:predicted amidophosphoribosyltransferase